MIAATKLFWLCLQMASMDICGNSPHCTEEFTNCAQEASTQYCAITITGKPARIDCEGVRGE